MNKIKNAWDFLCYFNARTVCVPCGNKTANEGMDIFQVTSKNELDHVLKNNKAKEIDTYLIINSGGSKLSQINALNAHFIDLDAGRNAKGKYKDPSQVAKFKLGAMARIKQFPMDPTAVVETRNGYQVYWALKGGASLITWNNTQKKIFTFFKDHGGDAKVLKANQILRMPSTYWFKKYEGKPSFFCKLLKFRDIKYQETQFQNYLESVKVTTVKSANPGIDSDAWKKNYLFVGGRWVHNNDTETARFIRSLKEATVVPNSHKKSKTNQVLPSDIGVLLDVADFLSELSQTLYVKGMRDSSKRAGHFANEIRNKFL